MLQDADDVSHPQRLQRQLEAALQAPAHTLLGANFERHPPGATRHYTAWANSLTQEQLVRPRNVLHNLLPHGKSSIFPHGAYIYADLTLK
jgi:hypothetical protein